MTVLNWDTSCVGHMQHCDSPREGGLSVDEHWSNSNINNMTMSIGDNRAEARTKSTSKRAGKRPGRKPAKVDERVKLERSRQSARECRARKKLRYQYLEELVLTREKAVFALRDELELYKRWCPDLDEGSLPSDLFQKVQEEDNTTCPDMLPGCHHAMLDFSKECFERDVRGSHREVT